MVKFRGSVAHTLMRRYAPDKRSIFLKFLLAWLAVVVSTIWVFSNPDFEPIIVFITSLLTAITLHIKKTTESQQLEDSGKVREDNLLTEPDVQEASVDPVKELANRVISVFENHGIHVNEIPRVTPLNFEITLAIMSEQSRLIEKVTPEFIDWVCETFNIEKRWLETGTGTIYDSNNYYKNEFELLRLLKNLKCKYGSRLNVFAFKNVSTLDLTKEKGQYVNLLIEVPMLKLGDRQIYKYIPTQTMWDWEYWRTRYQLKGIIKVLHKNLNLHFKGYDLDRDTMGLLAYGNYFPKLVLNNTCSYTWHPDDYTYSESESSCAKDTHELESILEYIDSQGYEQVFETSA